MARTANRSSKSAGHANFPTTVSQEGNKNICPLNHETSGGLLCELRLLMLQAASILPTSAHQDLPQQTWPWGDAIRRTRAPERAVESLATAPSSLPLSGRLSETLRGVNDAAKTHHKKAIERTN